MTQDQGFLRKHLKEMQEMKEMWIWVWNEFINKESKKLAFKMLFLLLLSYGIGIARPWSFSLIINGLDAKNLQIVIWGLIISVFAVIGAKLLNWKSMTCREIMMGENMCQLDQVSIGKFLEKSLRQHEANDNLLNPANIKKGQEKTEQLQGVMVFMGMEAVIGLVIPFAALTVLSWQLGIMAGFMLIIYLVWGAFLNQKIIDVCKLIEEKWRAMNNYKTAIMYGKERVITSGKEEDELAELKQQFDDVIKLDRKFWLWFIGQISLRSMLTSLIGITVTIYSVHRAWIGAMSVGSLCTMYIWIWYLIENLWQITHLEHQINRITPRILDMKKGLIMTCDLTMAEPEKAIKLQRGVPFSLEFRNVSYAYKAEDKITSVLKNVSFCIAPGEVAALIGKSGAGKSTIMKLIERAMDVDKGEILINGINIQQYDIRSLRQAIGYVPQSPFLFNGTIFHNVFYNLPGKAEKKDVASEEIEKIIEIAQLDFGKDGTDTVIGERGMRLSGGQIQRVALAAAIAGNPGFLLIDEATSSLDAKTERLVLEKVFDNILRTGRLIDKSALIITHRLATVRHHCSKFLFLSGNGDSNGATIETVAYSFEELFQKSPEFCSLAADQGIAL